MKNLLLSLTFLAGLPLALAAQVSKEDIKKLAAAGISDEVILSYVRANGGLAKLSAEDVVELKQAGASEKLLANMLSTPAAAPAPAPAERPVYTAPAPQTTYVYDSTPYYYTPSVYYSSYAPSYYYPRASYSYSTYPSNCYPRSTYPRTYYSSPSFSVGFGYGGGSRYCAPRGHVSTYIRR